MKTRLWGIEVGLQCVQWIDLLFNNIEFVQLKKLIVQLLSEQNYASNIRQRVVVPTTQLCDTVCKCSILETPNRWTQVKVTTELSWLTMLLGNAPQHSVLWPFYAFIDHNMRFKNITWPHLHLAFRKFSRWLYLRHCSILSFFSCEVYCIYQYQTKHYLAYAALFWLFFRVYCFCFTSCTSFPLPQRYQALAANPPGPCIILIS